MFAAFSHVRIIILIILIDISVILSLLLLRKPFSTSFRLFGFPLFMRFCSRVTSESISNPVNGTYAVGGITG